MRKTYVTRMPDKAGAFLLASRIIAACGGNIARVNYNRAVDTHTLFIEVSATAAQHAEIARQLSACGYLTELEDGKRILMIVLTLSDHPGAVTPVLEVLSRHRVNISYISSQENGTGVQHLANLIMQESMSSTITPLTLCRFGLGASGLVRRGFTLPSRVGF